MDNGGDLAETAESLIMWRSLSRSTGTMQQRRLVSTLLRSKAPASLDDCSPDAEIRALVEERATRGLFTLVRNEENARGSPRPETRSTPLSVSLTPAALNGS